MLISVIIPTRERTELLQACLDALRPQVGGLFECEVLICDDGLTDESRRVVADHYPEFRWIEGPHCGPAANRNSGAKAARGKWLIFLDDDCIPNRGFIGGYLASMASAKDNRVLEGKTYSDEFDANRYEAPVNIAGGTLPSCNFAIPSTLYREVGGFRECFKHWMEDVDFHRRVLLQPGVSIAFVEEAAVYHPPRLRPSIVRIAQRWRARVLFERLWGMPILRLLCWLPAHIFKVRVGSKNMFASVNIRKTVMGLIESLLVLVQLPIWLVADQDVVAQNTDRS